MRTTYLSELKELKTDILQMGSYIEEAIKNTMKALEKDDLIMAQEVINKDCIIDDAERTIESLCLKLFLTQQPGRQRRRSCSGRSPSPSRPQARRPRRKRRNRG